LIIKEQPAMKCPDKVQLSREDGEALRTRLAGDALTAADRRVLDLVLQWYFWLVFAFQEAKISLRRFRTLLFGKPSTAPTAPASETVPVVGAGDGGGSAEPAEGIEATKPETTRAVARSQEDAGAAASSRGGHRPGHGRLGADAYASAERVACHHEALRVGERCPVCGQGRLYALPPGVEIRIDGNALLSAIRYELEKLRCSACGEVFTAKVPDAAGAEKYSPRARAVLAVSRYYLGLPLYRVESYQAMLGVPVPDATQWDQIEKVGDCAYVVFEHLETLAAQGELIYQDDTAVRILSLLDENLTRQAEAEAQGFSPSKERTGMHTTALVVQVGERTICLYYCGRAHAGENLEALLTKREADRGKPLVMSDALTSNAADEATLIRCHCLAHGRRKFSELEDVFPQECQVVIEALKQVFDHDEHARNEQLSPEARLAYHQDYSRPIMDALKRWLDKQVEDRLVEPNGSLGKAIAYMQGHWETLTQFLSIPGAPLDNNLVERALKLFIRQRKNSLFYATEYSAYIASVLTSLIATCLHAGVNALEYLVALQEHRAEVFAEPSAWFPWTYQARLMPP
jgi:transposase